MISTSSGETIRALDPAGSEETSPTSIREFSDDDMPARQARDVVRDRERDQEGARGNARDERLLDESRARAIDDEDEEDDEDSEPPPAREGLPARFRMRHTPHYVDELLGDAPLRTVREIPVSEIESPSDDRAELDDLERSIRRLGVIEPLLVASGPPRRVLPRDRRNAPCVPRSGLASARFRVWSTTSTRKG